MSCVFCAIVAGTAPAWRVYADEDCLGFEQLEQIARRIAG